MVSQYVSGASFRRDQLPCFVAAARAETKKKASTQLIQMAGLREHLTKLIASYAAIGKIDLLQLVSKLVDMDNQLWESWPIFLSRVCNLTSVALTPTVCFMPTMLA